MSDINIDYGAAIDEALKEAAENEAENEAIVTELEPDPVAQETPVQEEVDIGQYFSDVSLETQEGLQEQETPPETLEGSEETPLEPPEGGVAEEHAPESQEETDPPSIEERLDDLTELLSGLQDLLKQLITGMEEQSKSIDSIGARVIDAVTTVMQHGGAKVAPTPKPAPAVEENSEGPSEAEKQNLETITALKERRS